MKKFIFNLVLGLFLTFSSYASGHCSGDYNDILDDGPYIYTENNKLKAKWIENGIIKDHTLTEENFPDLKRKFNLLFDYQDLKKTYSFKPDYSQSFTSIDSLSVISDIHGEFHAYISLLKSAGVIDDNLNWNYGRGHLIILGDSFDRGEMVTELLWHLFGLEKQAEKAGGMVHVLLGNHEFMVLTNDLTYINDKYKKTAEVFAKNYTELYSTSSVLGSWLRSKPVILTINDILFVHAGISTEMIRRKITADQTNRDFYDILSGVEKVVSDSIYNQLLFLVDNNGPVWYRGYFTEQDFSENMTDSILSFYDVNHIVVGHTHCEGINNIFKNKIFGIDAGISNNESGEMLIYKNGKFYRGLATGKRIEL